MNTNGQDSASNHKKKTIIASILAIVLIVLVGVIAISAALGTTKGESAKTETSQKEEKPKKDNKPVGTDAASPADQYVATDSQAQMVVEEETTVVQQQTNMPTTGPAEIVFSALMLGVVTFLIGLNVNLVKENQ